MFVLVVKINAIKGKEEQLVEALRKAITKVRQNEPNTLMYDLHREIDNPTELFFYERYKDKQAWEDTHMSAPYIKGLLDEIAEYLDGELEITQYELIEVK